MYKFIKTQVFKARTTQKGVNEYNKLLSLGKIWIKITFDFKFINS